LDQHFEVFQGCAKLDKHFEVLWGPAASDLNLFRIFVEVYPWFCLTFCNLYAGWVTCLACKYQESWPGSRCSSVSELQQENSSMWGFGSTCDNFITMASDLQRSGLCVQYGSEFFCRSHLSALAQSVIPLLFVVFRKN
jgi:hypothetical protein